MKILVSDPVSESALEALRNSIAQFDYDPAIKAEDLLRRIEAYDAIIVRSRTKVTKQVIDAATHLRVIGRAGVGTDNIDTSSAQARGVKIVNTPDALTNAVAEFTVGLMLGLSRKISSADSSMRAGKWEKSSLVGRELKDKTYGAIGLGRIGRRVAELVHVFGMKIIANDIISIPEDVLESLGITMCSREEVFSRADFVDLHIPLTPETTNLVNYQTFRKMKKNSYLINTARGMIVNEGDLLRAISEGLIAGAALDVFETEPNVNSKLIENEKIILTPHIAGQTLEAQDESGKLVVEEVLKTLRASQN